MSLRSFHLLFIALSAIMAAFFAAWSIQQYRAEPQLANVLSGVVGVALAGALVAYGAAFQKKTRGM